MKADPAILPLQLDGVVFERDGRKLLDDVTIGFEAGPRTLILGPNGAGKSLLLRICHGLLRPTRGAVRWQGGLAHGIAERQAMVFQRPVLLRRSALANLEYALRLRGIGRAERHARAREAIERTGLADKAATSARLMSVGEQQRLALARAWVLRPEVLFLDEPTASLDPASTRRIEEIIQSIHDGGTKIVMTSHDLGQARRLADEVVFLHHGRIVERAPAVQFFDRPQSREGAAFLQGELLW
jgi:tungstate transport system ATP-binding protein